MPKDKTDLDISMDYTTEMKMFGNIILEKQLKC